MISISKYLAGSEKPGAALKRALLLLLQGVVVHAVETDPADHERFRAAIEQAIDAVEQDPGERELMVLVGSVIAMIKDNSQRTAVFLRRVEDEHRNTTELLADTIRKLSAGSRDTVSRLDGIRGEIEHASLVDDLRVIRICLRECAKNVIDEIARERTRSAEMISLLQRQTPAAHPPESCPNVASRDIPMIDPVTGLPGRQNALAALSEYSGQPDAWVVAVVASRVRAINSRWGFAAGDHVLRSVAERLKKGLSAKDYVFRWRGAAMVAVLVRPGTMEDVRREVARIWNKSDQEMITVGTGAVMVPILTSWTVYGPQSAADWENKLESFAASVGESD